MSNTDMEKQRNSGETPPEGETVPPEDDEIIDLSFIEDIISLEEAYDPQAAAGERYSGILEKGYRQLTGLIESALLRSTPGEKNPESEILEGIVDTIADLDEAFLAGKSGEEVSVIFDRFQELGDALCDLYEGLEEPLEGDSHDLWLERFMEYAQQIPDDEFITENYLKLEKTASDFLDAVIPEKEFRGILEDMLEVVRQAKKDYQGYYIQGDEWTKEVSRGDQFLMEGLAEWEDCLKRLLRPSATGNEELTGKIMEKAFDANKKLVIVQNLAREVNNRIKKLKTLLRRKNL